ncbi:hypothetical protein CEXT_649911 [Caerostris extrusa]|uniref:Uncharacterized protein n=1 Tax=Caerostris extrusa TaxID=172846 RepID=A0AAV4R1F6_CAEEX|nr:hypothetical protein CEXT_649911 [Caerostris extrusa]
MKHPPIIQAGATASRKILLSLSSHYAEVSLSRWTNSIRPFLLLLRWAGYYASTMRTLLTTIMVYSDGHYRNKGVPLRES